MTEKPLSPGIPDKIEPSTHAASFGEAVKLKDNAHDQGAQLFQEVQEYSLEELEAESAKVRRIIDWNIMPIVSFCLSSDGGDHELILKLLQICITYTIQFLDKLSLNYASAYSFKEDLVLSG